jgi:CubicO group peptidase (beta-lactamase class C family)
MKTLITLLLLLLFAESYTQPLYFPPKNGTTWDTIAPSRLNWCPDKIDSLYNYLQQTNTDAFIVLKDGKIALEKYFGTFTKDSIHYWASAGKSLTAMLVGIAQQKGLLNINDSVSKYLGSGWSSEVSQKERLITVRNLLTMTSGLEDDPAAPCTNEDFNKECLQYKVDAGTRWAYHTGAYKKLQDIVSTVSGKTYNGATNEYIETPIGMTGAWSSNGVYFSTARNMARFGLLTLSRGIWDTDTIMRDSAYLRAMTNSSQSFNLSYGYLWWLNGKATTMVPGAQLIIPSSIIPNAPNDLICALGKNDQKIYVVPSKNIVVIRLGASAYGAAALSPYDTLIWNYINQLEGSCSISGIHEKPTTSAINIFPNPTDNFISFTEFTEDEHVQFKIMNLFNQLVSQGESYNHSIDVSELPKGIYYLSIENTKRQATTKFIKK